jgi:methylenetetrahydrofolate dehydrogenase (NADP+)/methenyltetrahydrofolate cyclohydrolase
LAKIISGTEIAKTLRQEIAADTLAFERQTGVKPGLAVVLVGTDPASQVYVRMKGKACREIGFESREILLPEDTPEDELLGVIDGLNADPGMHGMLVQLPLPKHLNPRRAIERIDPAKDVDGLHPVNVGRLAGGELDVLAPATPLGVIEMLIRSGHDPAGKRVVVVGRSNLVGKPVALLLLRQARGGNATVTVAHSKTPDLGAVTRQADILIAAAGRAGLITRDMVRPGVVVIDVGTNRLDDPSQKRGYRLVGDVDFEGVSQVAEAISPVPGGVGPMTITMLLANTLQAARQIEGAGAGAAR